jgi:hypothetical protein
MLIAEETVVLSWAAAAAELEELAVMLALMLMDRSLVVLVMVISYLPGAIQLALDLTMDQVAVALVAL